MCMGNLGCADCGGCNNKGNNNMNHFSLAGLGEGDFTDIYGVDTNNSIALPPSADPYLFGSGDPFPINVNIKSPSTSNVNWNSLLQQWTGAGVAIAKANAGANPTYQSTGPGGTVTIFGTPGGNMAIPNVGLPSGIGMGTILLGLGGLFIAMKMFGK